LVSKHVSRNLIPGYLFATNERRARKMESVVKVTHGQYSVITEAGGWRLKYEPDVTTVPKHEGSLLFAFDSTKWAYRFVNLHFLPEVATSMQVWICETDWKVYPDFVGMYGEFTSFWRELKLAGGLRNCLKEGKKVGDDDARTEFYTTLDADLSIPPPGTVLCPNLTPRVRIK